MIETGVEFDIILFLKVEELGLGLINEFSGGFVDEGYNYIILRYHQL